MTTDYAADAAGLVERAAAAYVAAVPEQPAGDGYFSPASVTWRVASDVSAFVAGLRALLLQALHPLAMAGVDQHSDWRRDPVGRLAATSGYLATVTYGDKASADRAATRVRRIHERVTGTWDGQPYAASDPDLLLWVHVTFTQSGRVAYDMFGPELASPLAPADADRFAAEMVIAAELLGTPREMIPASGLSLDQCITTYLPVLRITQAAADSSAYLLDPPGMDEEVADLWDDIREAALASLPAWALRLYGYPAPQPPTAQRRAEIRQTLGLLDALFIGEPGVLEARQRLTLRTRAAQAGGGPERG